MIPKWLPDLTFSEILSAAISGATVSHFERATAEKTGARYGLAFAYAHAGFYALLKALGLTQAEIILPAYTCEIMPAVVVATGNIPVFVDIDLGNYDMNPVAIRSAITGRTRMIVATSMFGYPSKIEAIRELVDSRPITIVEDAALAFPGATRLRGDVGLFSLGPGKPFFTVRGGIVVTNASDLYARMTSYRALEMGKLPLRQHVKRWALLGIHYLRSLKMFYDLTGRLNLSKDTFERLGSRWRPSRSTSANPGPSLPDDYATRYAAFQARLGLIQLDKVNRILARRREIARLYESLLTGVPNLVPAPVMDDASFSLYTVRVRKRNVQGFCRQMRSRGIETGRTFSYAVANLPKYQAYARGACPHAIQAGSENVNLPAFSSLSEEQIGYISDAIRQIMSSAD